MDFCYHGEQQINKASYVKGYLWLHEGKFGLIRRHLHACIVYHLVIYTLFAVWWAKI